MTTLIFGVTFGENLTEVVNNCYNESQIRKEITKAIEETFFLNDNVKADKLEILMVDGNIQTYKEIEKANIKELLPVSLYLDILINEHNKAIAEQCSLTDTDSFDAVFLWLYNRASLEAFNLIFSDPIHYWEKFNSFNDSGKFWHYLEFHERRELLEFVKNEYKCSYNIIKL